MEKEEEVKTMFGRKRGIGIFAGIICAMMISATAFAAQPSAEALIPAGQSFDDQSGRAAEDTFQYILKAENDKTPVPEGSENGVYSFSMTGTQEIWLDRISYVKPGIYRYEAYQTVEEPQDGYRYDDTVYTVYVNVVNTSSGGLEAGVVIQNEAGEKCENLFFENSFSDRPADHGGPGGDEPAETGDNAEAGLWLAVMAASGTAAVFLSVRRRKNTK